MDSLKNWAPPTIQDYKNKEKYAYVWNEKSSWNISRQKIQCTFFFLNLGVDCKKLPVCEDTEEDDLLDIGALG